MSYDANNNIADVENNKIKSLTSHDTSAELEHKLKKVIQIQKCFRGYLSRKLAKELSKSNKYIEPIPIRRVVNNEIIKRSRDWNSLCCDFLFLLLFILTIYFQIFFPQPNSYHVERALESLVNNCEIHPDDVTSTSDIYDFLDKFLESSYRGDPENTSDYCTGYERPDCLTDVTEFIVIFFFLSIYINIYIYILKFTILKI